MKREIRIQQARWDFEEDLSNGMRKGIQITDTITSKFEASKKDWILERNSQMGYEKNIRKEDQTTNRLQKGGFIYKILTT